MELGRTLLQNRASGETTYHPYPGQSLAQSVFTTQTELVPWPDGGFYLESMAAHGGWIASAADVLRFLHGTDGRSHVPDILSTSSIQAMIARPSLAEWQGTAWYYTRGWSVRPVSSDANWWHSGSRSIFVRSYDDFTWVALVNSRPASDSAFISALDDALWDAKNTVQSWPTHDLFDRYE